MVPKPRITGSYKFVSTIVLISFISISLSILSFLILLIPLIGIQNNITFFWPLYFTIIIISVLSSFIWLIISIIIIVFAGLYSNKITSSRKRLFNSIVDGNLPAFKLCFDVSSIKYRDNNGYNVLDYSILYSRKSIENYILTYKSYFSEDDLRLSEDLGEISNQL